MVGLVGDIWNQSFCLLQHQDLHSSWFLWGTPIVGSSSGLALFPPPFHLPVASCIPCLFLQLKMPRSDLTSVLTSPSLTLTLRPPS